MKNITKTLLVLVSALSISVVSYAGDLAITGSVKASYSIGGADDAMDKGIGVSNELKAAASGELDNGFTWNYHLDLDPGASGAMVQDDAALTVAMPGLGTIGFFDGEGSLDSNLKWGIGAMGTGSDYAGNMTIEYGGDIDAETNVQYHTPADLLPFGITAKIGYSPNMGDTTGGNDYKSTGGINARALAGNTATQYRVDAAPIDGLKIGADYYERGDETAVAQAYESGGYYAQYAIGNFKVGYGKELYAPALSTKEGNGTMYETDSYGVEFAVNDALTLSYSEEKSEETTNVTIAAGASSRTQTHIESKVKTIQAAYIIGGATLGFAQNETSESDYTAGKDEKVTMFSLAMEF